MNGLSWTYPVAPILAWLTAGSLKFLLNSVKARGPALKEVGLGGMPSTHTTIVVTMAALVGLQEGFRTAWFGVAATLAMIVMIDAMDLRRRIGQHAAHLQRLFPDDEGCRALRIRVGHSPLEVLGGVVTGVLCAAVLHLAAQQIGVGADAVAGL
jgi:hypothetical protein